MNRPRRSLPADLPPELLGVIGLLCVAGLFTGVPVLQSLPDAFKLLTDGGLWDSFGPLVLVLLAELGFFAVACFLLAWQLSQGDPVARVVTVVVAGSLAFGLLVGNGLDDGSATVTMLCSIAAVVGLTVPRRAREHFAGRWRERRPTPVVAAEALVVMLSAIMLAVGVAYLPVLSVKAKYAAVGLALIGIAGACSKSRRRLTTGDPAARTLVSGLMAGAVVAILLGGDGTLTGPLTSPSGRRWRWWAALAPPREPGLLPRRRVDGRRGRRRRCRVEVDEAYDDVARRPPVRQLRRLRRSRSGGRAPRLVDAGPDAAPGPSAAAARAPDGYRPSPFEPGPGAVSLPRHRRRGRPRRCPRPRLASPRRSARAARSVAPAADAVPVLGGDGARGGRALPPATPRPMAPPPRWPLEAPPPGFWPAERRGRPARPTRSSSWAPPRPTSSRWRPTSASGSTPPRGSPCSRAGSKSGAPTWCRWRCSATSPPAPPSGGRRPCW